jgi:hypothetical protein
VELSFLDQPSGLNTGAYVIEAGAGQLRKLVTAVLNSGDADVARFW